MKKLITVVALILTLWTSMSPVYANDINVEFVFTPEELQVFLQDHIKSAVDNTTAYLTREHEEEKIIWTLQLDEQKDKVTGLTKELRFKNVKFVIGVSVAAAAGFGIGYLVGKLM